MLERAAMTIRDMRETIGMPSGPGRDSLVDLHTVASPSNADGAAMKKFGTHCCNRRDPAKPKSASSNLPIEYPLAPRLALLRQRRVIAMIPVSRPSPAWLRSLPERCRLLHALASLNRRADREQNRQTPPAQPCEVPVRRPEWSHALCR